MSKAMESLKKRGAVYEKLGVRPIINAVGTATLLSGEVMEPEVVQAMVDASHAMVRMHDLNECAGKLLAKYTHAEAGHVTAGAANGLLLQAAACMTGKDPAKIKQLPDTEGMKNEIIVSRRHDNPFVQQWRGAGAKIVWVGSCTDEVKDCEIEAAINDKTAALGFIASGAHPDSFDSLHRMAEVAHRHGLPFIADAAGMLPPVENLWRFIEYGADMVSFSGGKGIMGPQSTGILCGRRDLIEAAALNHSPNTPSIGRGAKVCKEEIIGLLVALERYMQRDHAADQRRWREQCDTVAAAMADIQGVKIEVLQDDWVRPVPELNVHFTEDWAGPSLDEIVDEMAKGDPSIIVGRRQRTREQLFVNPCVLMEGEAELVGQRLRTVMVSGG